MSVGGLDPGGRPGSDAEIRRLLARAAPALDPPVAVDADLDRGRTALSRRRSLLTTLAVGTGTAVVAAAAVLVPQGMAGVLGSGSVPASETLRSTDEGSGTERPDREPRRAEPAPVGQRVPLVPGPQQHTDDVVATLVPQDWQVREADESSLTLVQPAGAEVLRVSPARRVDEPPVLEGVGDFEPVAGSRASYYLIETSGGSARPTMVLQLTNGTWAQVSASPALGWGMPELAAFASGLRAPFTCADPCEVPLSP